ncbi:hypothetical protein [Maridesulfovibrio ferrireducens]|uniref:hypothetical protein n=1 Tax=Maridesulfovibrio ferrireducens TaxID=246191 RepID=UPI001A2B6484|nr:hypothetical protein [Maridesulfovibrio ferrireducens]MBI9113352.1 hypothetical protein [Maridesulfovibrio ferrireducens]
MKWQRLAIKMDPQDELNALAEWAKNNENNRDHNFGLEYTFEAIALGFCTWWKFNILHVVKYTRTIAKKI